MKATRRTRARRVGTATLAMALILAACGGGDETVSADDSPDETASAPASSEPDEPSDEPSDEVSEDMSEETSAAQPDYELGSINPPSQDVNPDLLAAAQEEGEVHWYTGSTTYELVAAAFTDAYGIEVVANRQNSGAITTLYMSEADAGAVVADVIQAFNPPLYEEAAEKGYLQPLDPEEITNLDSLPSDLVSEYWFPSNSWIWGTVWNTDLVSEPIETWDDLLRPELQGQIVMADPRLGGLTAAVVNWMYDNLGEDYLRQLGDQQLQMVDSNVAALDRLAAGEIAVVLPTNSNNPDPLIEQGAPLQFGAPDDTSWFSHDVAVSADSDNPNAGKLLADYLISLEVQEGVSFAGPPVRADARSEVTMLDTYYQLQPEDVVEGEDRLDEFVELLQIN